MSRRLSSFIFFFNDTATTEIYTLSLHDALPISRHHRRRNGIVRIEKLECHDRSGVHRKAVVIHRRDRKSTRLNSSHGYISYAVFCLKKKNIATLHMRDTDGDLYMTSLTVPRHPD